MIVRCKRIISPATGEDLGDESPWLKRENEYPVIALSCSALSGIKIIVQSEHFNQPMLTSLLGFEIVSDKMPSNWVTEQEMFDGQILITMHPQSWSYEGFYEELEEETPKAVALFNSEAELIYEEEGLVMPASRRLV